MKGEVPLFSRKVAVMRTRKYGKLFRFVITFAIIITASFLISYGWQRYEEEKYPEGTEENYSLPNAFLDFAQLVTDFFSKDSAKNDNIASTNSGEKNNSEVTEIIGGTDNPDPKIEDENSGDDEPLAAKGGIVEETKAANESSFSSSVFVGDYFVYYADYMKYCEYAEPVYATEYDLNTLLSKKIIRNENEEVMLIDYIASIENVKAIYIMLSAESISWMDYPTFVKKYITLIDEIIAVQPDACIYIQSILPINSEETEKRGYSVTNEKIDQINSYLASISEEKKIWYLNVAEEFKDENGELPYEMTTNGIRLTDEAYAIWYDYILTHKAH